MFRRRRTVVNGIELPEEFAGASVVNNVAISEDGKRYAYITPECSLFTGDMPSDGKLKIGGTTIEYHGTPKRRVSFSGIIFSLGGISVVSVGSGSTIRIGNELEYEIDKSYDSVSAVKLHEIANDVTLGLSDDGKVYVQGFTAREPENKAGRLYIDGLAGKLQLPQNRENLTLEAKLTSGDISGAVAHGGMLTTVSGDINLKLYTPLTLEVSTISGDVSVIGMMAEGRRTYSPPNSQPKGRLVVETISGDINVRYMQR